MDGQVPESAEPRKIGRRAMLFGAVTAVAGGALVKVRSAGAVVGNLILGQTNQGASAPTSMVMFPQASPSPALRVDNLSSGGGIGLMGAIQAPPISVTATAGIVGLSGANGGGVVGIAGGLPGTPFSTSNAGVSGLAPGGTGVQGLSDVGTGVAGGGRTGVVGKASPGPGVGGLSGPAGVAGWGPPGDGAAVIGIGGGYFPPVGTITVTADAGIVGVSPRAGVIGIIAHEAEEAAVAVQGGFLDPAGGFTGAQASGLVAGVLGTSPPGQGIGVIGVGGGFRTGADSVTLTAATGVVGIAPTTGIVGAATGEWDTSGVSVPTVLDVEFDAAAMARIGVMGLGRLVRATDPSPVTVTSAVFVPGNLNAGVFGLSGQVGVIGATRDLDSEQVVGLGDSLRAGIIGTFGRGSGVTLTADAGIAGLAPTIGVIGFGGRLSVVSVTVTTQEVTGSAGLVGISPSAGIVGFLARAGASTDPSVRYDIPAGFAVAGIVGDGAGVTLTSDNSVGVLGSSPGIGMLGLTGSFDSQAISPTMTAGVFGLAGSSHATGIHAANYAGGIALDVAGRARFSTTGVGTIPVAVDTFFVNDVSVSASSLVLVTLTDDPGKLCTLQWVETMPGSGFALHLQGRTRRPATFAYVVLDR